MPMGTRKRTDAERIPTSENLAEQTAINEAGAVSGSDLAQPDSGFITAAPADEAEMMQGCGPREWRQNAKRRLSNH